MTDPNYLLPSITVAGAFGAAYLGQRFAHRYARKRDEEKYKKDCLQNLYSPLIYRVEEYLYGEKYKSEYTPNPFIGESEELINNPIFLYTLKDTNKMFQEILSIISNNLSFAHPELIMKYEIAKGWGEYNYGQDKPELVNTIFTMTNRIELCSVILSDYININKKLGTLSKSVYDRLLGPYFFTHVFLVLMDLNLHDLALNHSFRSFHLICNSIELNKSLLEDAERIRKKHNKMIDYLEEFSNRESDDINVDSYQLIYNLLDLIEYFEPEESTFWKQMIEKNRVKEEQQFNTFLKEHVNKEAGPS
ncbi:hypothetical protein V6B14_12785 [Sporosarcina psychrophila]|uniref:hypothetical protein n=1 Tax=Sporosarcina psychrophila TaxID=1476 RepID=UPI0030CC2F94